MCLVETLKLIQGTIILWFICRELPKHMVCINVGSFLSTKMSTSAIRGESIACLGLKYSSYIIIRKTLYYYNWKIENDCIRLYLPINYNNKINPQTLYFHSSQNHITKISVVENKSNKNAYAQSPFPSENSTFNS